MNFKEIKVNFFKIDQFLSIYNQVHQNSNIINYNNLINKTFIN